jgi:phosphodiesterase/alkaline phosphatase D-like protein
MAGVVVDWGPNVNSVYTNATSGDPGLIKSLANASGATGTLGGLAAQYMDTSGHNAANSVTYGQQYQITPSVTSSTIFDSQIQSELAAQIQAGHLPRPSGNGLQAIYLILFPSGDTECFDQTQADCSGSTFCAYHSNATLSDGTNVLYAVLPDNLSGPMSFGCGNASTLFGDQTSYTSHEWYETITDPLGTAWWDSSGNEIGDKCNQLMTIQGGYSLQQEWSNLDQACGTAASAYSAPTASFLAPSTGTPGQQASFDASSSSDPSANRTSMTFSGTSYSISSGIASYQWSWGDGTSSAGSAQSAGTHAYSSVGTYQVSLTVIDQLGFKSTVTHQIAILGTPTPSATTGSATAITSQGATLNGTVNPHNQTVSYQFIYGASSSALNQSTTLTAGPSGQTDTAVNAALTGLSPSTTYFYRLNVISGGQTYSGATQSFTTSAAPVQTPVVTTAAASQITSTGALLNGTINPGGSQAVTYSFAYGTSSTQLNSSTAQTTGPSGTTVAPVSSSVSGLHAATTYFFKLNVTSGGQTYSGTVRSFTTNAAPPPPQTPTVTTGTASQVNDQSAVLGGTINPNGSQPVSYSFAYGTSSSSLDHATAPSTGLTGTTTVPVTTGVSGLSPTTTYFFRLNVSFAGQTYSGAVHSFTTNATPPPPQVPIVATGGASQLRPTSALVAGTINPHGPDRVTYQFAYGTSTSSLSHTTSRTTLAGGTTAAPVSATVTGLSPNTAYYFRLDVSYNGHTYSGAVASFTTPIPAPSVSTGSPSQITSTGATISGVVNPNGFQTSYHFEYGTTTAYGHSSASFSAGAGNSNVQATLTLGGLASRTIYHFRLVAQNAGGTAVGGDSSLTTRSALARSPHFTFRLRSRSALRDALGGRMRVSFSCNTNCSAYFAVTIAPSGGTRGVALPLTVARATGRIPAAGSGSVPITFIPTLRSGLRHSKPLKLLVSAYAVGAGTTPSAPLLKPVTLTP